MSRSWGGNQRRGSGAPYPVASQPAPLSLHTVSSLQTCHHLTQWRHSLQCSVPGDRCPPIMLKHCQSLSSDPPPPRPAPCPGSPSPPPLPPRFALCTDTISLSSSSSSSGSRCGSRWDSLKIHYVKMTKLDLLNSNLQSTHLKYCMLLTFIFLKRMILTFNILTPVFCCWLYTNWIA